MPDWTTAVFTSEIGFLLHFPIFLHYDKNPGIISLTLFFARIFIHTIALPLLVWDARHDLWSWKTLNSVLWGSYSGVGWSLMAVSAVLYAFAYGLHVFLKPKLQPVQPVLYGTAHVSVLNFLFDLPGRGVPTVKRSHTLLVVVNVIAGLTLLVTHAIATPLQEAWGCYQPSLITSLRDYNRGVCPGDPTSTANICTERPYTNCEENFEVDVFAKEMHYALQGIVFGLIVYGVGVGSKLSFYKLQVLET